MIRAIVCCAKDYGIGKANGLLFDIPEDMMHFRKETIGKICVFGYNTYMSLPKRPLKSRVNIVLWDKATSMDCLPGAITFNDFGALMNFITIMAKEYDVYICGGAGLYASTIDYVDYIDLTMVDAIDENATAFFPDPLKAGFVCSFADTPHKTDGELGTNGYVIQSQIWTKPKKEAENIVL